MASPDPPVLVAEINTRRRLQIPITAIRAIWSGVNVGAQATFELQDHLGHCRILKGDALAAALADDKDDPDAPDDYAQFLFPAEFNKDLRLTVPDRVLIHLFEDGFTLPRSVHVWPRTEALDIYSPTRGLHVMQAARMRRAK